MPNIITHEFYGLQCKGKRHISRKMKICIRLYPIHFSIVWFIKINWEFWKNKYWQICSVGFYDLVIKQVLDKNVLKRNRVRWHIWILLRFNAFELVLLNFQSVNFFVASLLMFNIILENYSFFLCIMVSF